MTTELNFPKLRNLLGAYFCPYWEQDYDWEGNEPSFEQVVEFYKSSNPPATVTQATEELRQLLSMPLDETDLRDAVSGIGVFDNPRAFGVETYRQWLEAILKILADPNSPPSTLRFVG